jgi:hypothetical protein
MLRLIKVLLVLVVLGLIALTGYAFLGDMEPARAPVEVPVTLNPS